MTKEQITIIRNACKDKIITIHLDNDKYLYVNAKTESIYFDDTNEILVSIHNYVYDHRNSSRQMITGFYPYDCIQRMEVESSYEEGVELLTGYNKTNTGTVPGGVSQINKDIAVLEEEASVY